MTADDRANHSPAVASALGGGAGQDDDLQHLAGSPENLDLGPIGHGREDEAALVPRHRVHRQQRGGLEVRCRQPGRQGRSDPRHRRIEQLAVGAHGQHRRAVEAHRRLQGEQHTTQRPGRVGAVVAFRLLLHGGSQALGLSYQLVARLDLGVVDDQGQADQARQEEAPQDQEDHGGGEAAAHAQSSRYPMPQTVTSRSPPSLNFFLSWPTWTSTVLASPYQSIPHTASRSCCARQDQSAVAGEILQ